MSNAFSKTIIGWYKKNKRDLPWRNTTDPYLIWLSEIIMQQTRVEQGLPYYHRFVESFPDVKSFAKADEEKILKLWQGLGYYSRARNMHHTAQLILKDHQAKFPNSFDELLKLKGIGRYTAAAIASFAFNKPHAVVDGNVYRLLSRYYSISTPIDSTQGKKDFENLAQSLMDEKQAGLFNQAMMELGAMVCKPANPLCVECPLQLSCCAFKENTISAYPVKSKKQKVRNRWFNYLVLESKSKIILKKRTGNDIWKNLYDFPLIETKKKISVDKILATPELLSILNTPTFHLKKVSHQYIHKLSHQTIHAVFMVIEISQLKKLILEEDIIAISKNELPKFPLPKLIEMFVGENDLI